MTSHRPSSTFGAVLVATVFIGWLALLPRLCPHALIHWDGFGGLILGGALITTRLSLEIVIRLTEGKEET